MTQTLITIPIKNIYKASKLFRDLTYWCHYAITKNNKFTDEELASLFQWCCINGDLADIVMLHIYFCEIDATVEESKKVRQFEIANHAIYFNYPNANEVQAGGKNYKIYK